MTAMGKNATLRSIPESTVALEETFADRNRRRLLAPPAD
jgi:hypothetical protein